MNIVLMCLAFLLAVVISDALSRLLPSALPRPVVQIAFGAAIGLFSGSDIALDPELFFLLFVPPLLFLDG